MTCIDDQRVQCVTGELNVEGFSDHTAEHAF